MIGLFYLHFTEYLMVFAEKNVILQQIFYRFVQLDEKLNRP